MRWGIMVRRESFPSPIFVLGDGFTDVSSSLKISK